MKRLISFVVVIWGVVTLSFCLQVFTGTDPAEMIVRKNSIFATEEQIQAVREQLGLDAPFHERYFDYITGVATGDLGTAITNRQPVIENIKAALPVTCTVIVISWFLRMARSYAKTECGKEYIEASKVSGASDLRIVIRHLIPNVLPQFIVYFTTGIATAIMSVSSFAFLGVGLIAGTPEWGAMLDEARSSIYINPSLIIYPGICLIICCAGFNLLGEGLRDTIGKEDEISAT